jgi:hypothetical protein
VVPDTITDDGTQVSKSADMLLNVTLYNHSSLQNICTSTDPGVPCPRNVTFSTIKAINGSAQLHTAPNGNIYSFDPGRFDKSAPDVVLAQQFSGEGPFVTGSADGAVLHGYRSEINEYNVSRLRLSQIYQIPSDSLPLSLVMAAGPQTQLQRGAKPTTPQFKEADAVMVATDTSANMYVLITCAMQSTYSKVFLATAIAVGLRVLQRPGFGESFAGDKIRSCQAVGYTTGYGPM